MLLSAHKRGCECAQRELKKKHKVGDANPICFVEMIAPSTAYHLKVKLEVERSHGVHNAGFKTCAWKKCPDNTGSTKSYSVDEKELPNRDNGFG